ncbi:hypothetical protein EDF64_104200 [Curtobacterium flaccumfaciens]|uniref:Uncharacterized protein n=1 Tax=Curtobacterium flaccumfaciens TaxID=2035 RepID=A0A4R6DJB4_9MICO|nr:hypothetical protein [Curtobacterium flaccumfaciens]TDN44797.1 hypothetical protein EDF64_104200 [Curtobacterium flaccumfaciens]
MQPFVARCFLVGASVVLVAVGALVPLSGAARAVVLVAAGCCAVLDVLLVRGGRAMDASTATAVLGPPPTPTPPQTQTPTQTQAPTPTQAPTATPTPPPVSSQTRRSRTVTLGTGPDGHAVELVVDGARAHIVVVGTGALAHAVFRALAIQVRAVVDQDSAVVRSAAAPDLVDIDIDVDVDNDARKDVDVVHGVQGTRHHSAAAAPQTSVWAPESSTTPPRPRLPAGTAVLAVDPHGPTPTTLVLVPGLGQLPRRFDLVVEVTRYGCTARGHDKSRGVPIAPALPQIVPPGSDAVSAVPRRPAPRPPGRRRRAPARPSPP